MDSAIVDKKWKAWVKGKSHIRSKLSPIRQRKQDHLLTTHAASEAALRRILFVGLRMKKVTYKSASDWMDRNPITFSKDEGGGNFITHFNRLFKADWASVLNSTQDLGELWILWNDYTKPIRNHLAHALQIYSDEWLDTALAIDRLFLMRLDKAIRPIIGGTPFAHLKNLSPTLPRGQKHIDPWKVLNMNKKNRRPRMSLTDAKTRLERL